ENFMTLKDKLAAEYTVTSAAFTTDAHLAALAAERRKLGRRKLTTAEWQAVVDRTNARIEAGEDPLDLLDEYGNMYMSE
ncbi:MAG: hypothetical protein U1E11_00350, partial [Dethiobacteria bacterium]|nr:hypothetical protein [Dethiobacteria bacterium]